MTVAVVTVTFPILSVLATTSSGDEKEESTEGGEILDDVFGEIVFYRWDRVYKADYPTDKEWHPTLLVWGRDKGKTDDGYIGTYAPDLIYRGPSCRTYPGVTHQFGYESPWNTFQHDGDIKEDQSFFINTTDKAEGIDVGTDPQVQTSKDTFYTNDDRGCLYVQYGGTDGDNEGVDGQKCPKYAIKMSKSSSATQDYYLDPDHDGGQAQLNLSDAPVYEWVFKSYNSDNRGLGWRLFENVSSHDDPVLGVDKMTRFVYLESDYNGDEDEDNNLFKWFQGTALRYSAITQDVKVKEGQILSISASNYVDTAGNAQNQSGVVIKSGVTVTVEKGGILSVSGDLINDGFIVNNGGTIIVQDGGSIFPFLQGEDTIRDGCGSIQCVSGDIIVEKGGALYSGLNSAGSYNDTAASNALTALIDGLFSNLFSGFSALNSAGSETNSESTDENNSDATYENSSDARFELSYGSVLVNYGVVGFGSLWLGNATTIENRKGGYIWGGLYEVDGKSFTTMLKDMNQKLSSGIAPNGADLRQYPKIYNVDRYLYGGIRFRDFEGLGDSIQYPTIYYSADEKNHLKLGDAEKTNEQLNWKQMEL